MVINVNVQLYEEMCAGLGRPGMGSTIVGVILQNGNALIFNVGDSRLYTTIGKWITLETIDDSLRGKSIGGKPCSHALTQCIGGNYSLKMIRPHVKLRPLSEEDGILLCSDGLTDMLSDVEIGEVIGRDTSQPADALVSAALDAGGLDNISVIVVGASLLTADGTAATK
jgi:protein phosphatase